MAHHDPDHQPTHDPRRGPADPAPPRRVLRARTPEDLLAVVPVVLGFRPRDSVVMLTTGHSGSFHARTDLPPRPRRRETGPLLDDLVDLLLTPARRHAVRQVALVLYTGDAPWAQQVVDALARALTRAGVEVAAALRAHDEHWWSLDPDGGRGDRPVGPGTPYRCASHPFSVQSVVEGRVVHASRDDLAATLDTDRRAAARVQALVEDLLDLPHPPVLPDEVDLAACLLLHVQQETCLTDEQLAGVALAVCALPVRDAAWASMRRSTARAHVRLWSDAVRRCPVDLVAGPASVLAFAAWLAGEGALAWCAVDRALATDPANTLAAMVAEMLEAAVAPSRWEEARLAC